MNNDPGGIKELTTYLAETTSGTDLIYKKNDNTLVYVSSRRPREKIEEESNHIVNFTCLLADKDQTTTTTITAKIFIREFKDSIHNIDNFIDSTYQIFEQEQANITDGVTVYEK